jgi:hypothetical protein
VPGIEFLSDEPSDDGPDEVLDPESRRPLARWLFRGGIVAVVAALVVAIALRGDNMPSRPPASTGPSSAGEAPGSANLGEPLEAGVGRPVLDVAVSGATVWLLQSRSVQVVAANGPITTGAVPGRPLVGAEPVVQPRLLLDPDAAALWVVVTGGLHGRVLEYDPVTLKLRRDLGSTPPLGGAAALDGRLYVSIQDELLVLAPTGSELRSVGSVPGFLGELTADPVRDRLLMIEVGFGGPNRLWTASPGGTRTAVADHGEIALGMPALALAADALWSGDFDVGRGTLVRIDLTTLRTDRHSPLEGVLGSGAVVAGRGRDVIWIHDRAGGVLRCLDARTGQQLQSWLVDGRVASSRGLAVVGTDRGGIRLRLSGCPG